MFLKYRTFENIGKRKSMEDHILIETINFMNKKFYFFGVIDGHGGDRTASFFCNSFKSIFLEELKKKYTKSISEILHQTILNIENRLKQIEMEDGAVLAFILIYKKKIYLCHLGDAFMEIFNDKKLIYSSIDHDLNNKNEISRVKKYGFIKNNRVNGILQPTRSIGDFSLKPNQQINENPVVPFIEIKRLHFSFTKLNIILASDGLHYTFNRKNFNNYINILNKLSLKDLQKLLINKKELIDNLAIIFLQIT